MMIHIYLIESTQYPHIVRTSIPSGELQNRQKGDLLHTHCCLIELHLHSLKFDDHKHLWNTFPEHVRQVVLIFYSQYTHLSTVLSVSLISKMHTYSF